jgi:phage-related protein (TIGR01555 family)
MFNWFGKKKTPTVVDAQPVTALSPTNRALMAGDGLMNYLTGMGTSHDKTTRSRYMAEIGLNRYECDALARSSWLGAKVRDCIVDDMTCEWRKPMWDGSQDDDGIFDIEKEEERLQVPAKVHSNAKWGRHYGGDIMVMIVKGQTRREQLAEPLDVTKIKKGDLINLVSYDRWRVYGTPPDKRDYSKDSSLFVPYLNQSFDDPNFGLPEFYYLSDVSIKIHQSRCIRFGGVELPWIEWQKNAMWDDSIYKVIARSLTAYDELMSACRQLVQKASTDIFGAEGLVEQLADADGTAVAQQRYAMLAMMMSVYNIAVIDKDKENFDRKPLSFAGLRELADRFALDVAGAADVPLTRLFGQAPSGLNTDGDSQAKNYNKHIKARQASNLTPQMQRLDQVLVRSALGYMPDDYKSKWNPLYQLSEGEEAGIGLQRAQTDEINLRNGTVTREACAVELRTKNPNLPKDIVDKAKKADERSVKLAEALPTAPKPGAEVKPGVPKAEQQEA